MKKKMVRKDSKKPTDFVRLTYFIGNKFDVADKRLDAVDRRFNVLIKEMDKRFNTTDSRFDNLEKIFRQLQGAVDSYAKRADTYFQEMVMFSHQLNRHEKWIRQIAEKLQIKLEA